MLERPEVNGNLAQVQQKVIVIDAMDQPDTQKLRVAAYCRVSSDSSDQLNSFMAQLNHYTDLVNSKDTWTLVDIYADEGITGTSTEKRQDFQRLISDCQKGLIDKVLVKSISRFARNTTDCLETIRELKSIGVGICFEEQNIDTSKMSGELLTAMFASIAQKESESISGNMRWSYKRRMESGNFITCKAPFGYSICNGSLVINDQEAQIVQMIYSQYLSGKSQEEIAKHISTLGIPTRDGNMDWQQSTISYILQNEKYIGDALLQKKYSTDILPYQKRLNLGERDQYYLTGSHPAIIDKETFYAAAQLISLRAKKISTQKHTDDPLSRKLICGHCGTLFKRTGQAGKVYWVCRNHFKSKDNCPITQIPEQTIQTTFLRLYHKLKAHGPDILTHLLRDLRSIQSHRILWSEDIIGLNKRISQIMDQDRMLASMNQNGLVDPDIFISQSNELEYQLRLAKQEKERLVDARDDDTIDQTKSILEELNALPEFLPTFDGEIFTALIEKITVKGNGELRFHLKNGLQLTESFERKR